METGTLKEGKVPKTSKKDLVLTGMLIFVPLAFISEWLHLPPVMTFAVAGLAIIPLAGLIANSTEAIAAVIGPSLGGLLNATFGNATEMIISIVALHAGLVEVVKASITGTIVANLLLALGAAITLGGLRFKEQFFQPTVARISASSLNLALVVLLTPTAIDFTSNGIQLKTMNQFSAVSAILLLGFYLLSLLFSMKTHKSLYEIEASDAAEGEDEHASGPVWKQIGILFAGTVVLVFVSEVLVASLEQAIALLGLTSLFTGVILIPIFGGMVEYITAGTFAIKNKMDLAVAVAMGSSLQIAMFVAPVLVIVGQIMGQPMNLDFNPFEVLAVAIAVLITNSISTDGRSNWLEGALLLTTYAIIGAAFYFHP
jgi:Ca2+:H+ antiporter